MKCKVFTGTWTEAMDAFNKWAKGKALSKDVIIHTVPTLHQGLIRVESSILIVVYHPDDPFWN